MDHKFPSFASAQPEELPKELPAGVLLYVDGEGWIEAIGPLILMDDRDYRRPYQGEMRREGRSATYVGRANPTWVDWTSWRKILTDNVVKEHAKKMEALEVRPVLSQQEQQPLASTPPLRSPEMIRAGHVSTLRLELDRPISFGTGVEYKK